jgi:hypothetical protein
MLFLASIAVAVVVAFVLVIGALLAPPTKTPSEELRRENDAADRN